MMQAWVTAKYTLIEAYKRRFILLYLVAVLLCVAIASYTSSLALTQKLATFAAFYGFAIRIVSVVVLGIYLLLSESKALDKANVFMALGLPLSRAHYLASKLLAYAILLLLMLMLAAIPLLWTAVSLPTLFIWAGTLGLELLIIVAVALMLTMMFAQPMISISLLAVFYFFARSSAEFIRHSNNLLAAPGNSLDVLLAWTVKVSSLLVPKLEQFAAASWLLYDDTQALQTISVLTQSAVYLLLLLLIAFERLRAKAF